MTEYAFGSGTLIGVRTDITNATPSIFGVLQEIQVDFDFTTKDLTGQYQAPVAIARSNLKITGKAKLARIVSSTFQNLFFGQTQATGGILQAVNEAQSVASSTPYNATASNSATWQTDLGVIYASGANAGLALSKVASSPTQGQYSVSAGVYSFAAGDAGAAVWLNYTYTASSGAQKITLTNQLMGAAPSFQVNLAETYNAKVFNLQLNACVSDKLSLPFKNSDWTISELDFAALADATGTIGYITTTE
jgi:hypothetical protein